MRHKLISVLFAVGSLGILGAFSFGLYKKEAARLWLVKDSEIVEYDTSTWGAAKGTAIPEEVAKNPKALQITRTGEMLFCLDSDRLSGVPAKPLSQDIIWIWDGKAAFLLDRKRRGESSPQDGSGGSATDRSIRLSLSANVRELYWFENEFRKLKNKEGAEQSVSTTYRVFRTDLDGKDLSTVASYSFATCKCETGACSETCPEAEFWFPDSGVDDYFFVNRWIPGQLGATFLSSFLYQRSGGKWESRKLPQPFEGILDAAQGGSIVIHSIGDGGCCGWDNVGDDQTIISAAGKNTVIFDERQRYANPNYDVSFFTSTARFSPNQALVAVNIAATAQPGSEIRLSDSGKEDLGELDRIRNLLGTMPLTEVIPMANPSQPLVSLPHAAFVGWLSEEEILIVENGAVVAFDVSAKTRRATTINVTDASAVFLR